MQNKPKDKRKISKAIILRNLLKGQLIESIHYEKQVLEKNLSSEGITKSNLEFHFYSKKNHEEGLIAQKIIRSEKGVLSLNLRNGRSLSKMIEYLENDPKVGSRIKYFFERAFIETFFSNYGHRSGIRLGLYQYLDKKSEQTKSLLELGSRYFEEMNIKIGRLERIFKDKGSRIDYHQRSTKRDRMLEKILSGTKPFFTDGPDEDVSAFSSSFSNRSAPRNYDSNEDLISVLVDFTKKIMGEITIPFMLGYIFNVIEISRMAEGVEIDWEEADKNNLLSRISSDFVARSDRKEIMAFLSKASVQTFDFFLEKVIKEAIKEPVNIENPLGENDSVLPLYTGRIALCLFLQNSEIIDKTEYFMHLSNTLTVEELLGITTSVPNVITPRREAELISENLAEITKIQIEAQFTKAKAASLTLGLIQDISGVVTEGIMGKLPDFLRDFDEHLKKS